MLFKKFRMNSIYILVIKRFIKYENLCSGIVNTEWPGRFDIRQIGNRTVILMFRF